MNYETENIWLAACILHSGGNLADVKVEKTTNTATFCFGENDSFDLPGYESYAKDFFEDQLLIEPRSLASLIKDLKDEIRDRSRRERFKR